MATSKQTTLKKTAATNSYLVKSLPFLMFLAFLAMIYIANAHYSERNIRQIHGLQEEIKDLRFQYMSIKSDIMFETKQSKIAKQVEEKELNLAFDNVYIIHD